MSTASMSVPDGTLHVLDGRAAADRETELIALHAEVTGAAGGAGAAGAAGGAAGAGVDADAGFARRLGVWRRQPGFVLVEARHGGYLVGYACGMPLRPSTDWWRGLTAPLPEAVTAEHPGRTFALTQLAVRASWRRQGIAAELHDLILDGRGEERATAKLAPGASAAQAAFRTWGWTRVARARDPAAPSAQSALVFDVLTRPL